MKIFWWHWKRTDGEFVQLSHLMITEIPSKLINLIQSLLGQRMTQERCIGFTAQKRTLRHMKKKTFFKSGHQLPWQRISKGKIQCLHFSTEKSLRQLRHLCLNKQALFGESQRMTFVEILVFCIRIFVMGHFYLEVKT